MTHATLSNASRAVMLVLAMTGTASAQSSSADLNRDGRIDEMDVALLRDAWGPCAAPCAADLNGDGVVDALDVIDLLDAAAAGAPGQPALNLNAVAVGNDDHHAVVRERMPEFLDEPVMPTAAPHVPHSLSRPGVFQAGVNVLALEPLTAQRIAQADLQREAMYGHIHPGPKRVGIVRTLDPAAQAHVNMPSIELQDGDAMWIMEIRSPGAFHMRAHFEDVALGRSTLVIYGFLEDGSAVVKGPYTAAGPDGDGDFWSASVPGEVMRIEVVGPDAPQFTITEIAHFDDPMTGPVNPAGGDGGAAGALGCHIDVMCVPVSNAARQSTGQMNYMSGGNAFVCTGTLIGDEDPETVVPYFLTAYHCVNTQAEVNSLQVVWFWQSSSCNGSLPNYSSLPSNTGGTLLVTNDTDDGNDMAFIRLTGGLPGGIAFAGWTTSSLGNNGFGVHHPAGTFKRYTSFLSGSGVCLDPNDYDYYEVFDGAIEGGSSGSGIFNSSGQLSGQLFGFCNQTDDPPCNEQEGSTAMYGEFESTWEDTDVSDWLNLGGTIWVSADTPFPPGEGTAALPFATVTHAVNFAWNGTQIKIHDDSYDEALIISKRITLRAVGGSVIIGQ